MTAGRAAPACEAQGVRVSFPRPPLDGGPQPRRKEKRLAPTPRKPRKSMTTPPKPTKRGMAAPPARGQRLTVVRGDDRFEFEDRLPLLPLRDVVIFPTMTLPLLVGRLPSINAIEKAVARDRMLFVTAQKRSDVADPGHDELYKVGTVVRVLQLFRLPDGTM